MKEKDLQIINTILKNSISKDDVKKLSKITDWYKELNYSKEIYSSYINYLNENEEKSLELGLFIFKYLISTDELKQLRSLIDIDLSYQKYIEESPASFLKIIIQFINYGEHWSEILKKIAEIEKNKNKDFFINNIDLLFNNYKPISSIFKSLFKKQPIEYWFGDSITQNNIKQALLNYINKDKKYFKSNKEYPFNNIEVFAEFILERKDSSKLQMDFKYFLDLFQLYNKDYSFPYLEEMSKNLKKEDVECFLSGVQKDKSISDNKKQGLTQEIIKIKALIEKAEIKSIVKLTEKNEYKKRI